MARRENSQAVLRSWRTRSPEGAYAGPASRGFSHLEQWEVARRSGRRFRITRRLSAEPIPACEVRVAEEVLVKLIGRAYAARHPEQFAARPNQCQRNDVSGLQAAARADAVAPAAEACDPDCRWSMEHDNGAITKRS